LKLNISSSSIFCLKKKKFLQEEKDSEFKATEDEKDEEDTIAEQEEQEKKIDYSKELTDLKDEGNSSISCMYMEVKDCISSEPCFCNCLLSRR
jgi:hypothetical protein